MKTYFFCAVMSDSFGTKHISGTVEVEPCNLQNPEEWEALLNSIGAIMNPPRTRDEFCLISFNPI
jgi:hypothetical protein